MDPPQPSFNLIDRPWIPCLRLDGQMVELSIKEALHQAHDLRALVGETPPITVTLHRLLIAILHRAAWPERTYGPNSMDEWAALWERGHFDAAHVGGYLGDVHDRFDLFDARYPFYQTPGLDVPDEASAAKLLFQSDNNPTLFDHSVVAHPSPLSPAWAARLLIAFQAFDVGGLVTGTGAEKSARAGPLLQCAVAVIRGRSLFETLLLNLHWYSPANEQPWAFDASRDRPAWEREEAVRPEERLPDGHLDLLTWQSRRILLRPERAEDGRICVRRAARMKGYQFPPSFERRRCETMVAFRENPHAKPGMDPFPPLGFDRERALWRDSVALLDPFAKAGGRPRMFSWLKQLADEDYLESDVRLVADFYGLAADRAKPLFWRHERFTAPLAYLDPDNETLWSRLREALELAERTGSLLRPRFVPVVIATKTVNLPSPVRRLAIEILGANGAVAEFVEHLAPERAYWSRLDEPFRELLHALPGDSQVDETTERHQRDASMRTWAVALRNAALDAFREATDGLDGSARTLRAGAIAAGELHARLGEILGVYRREDPAGTGGGPV